MRLTVIQQGRLRDAQVTALCAEYRKRFQRFGTLTVLDAAAGRMLRTKALLGIGPP